MSHHDQHVPSEVRSFVQNLSEALANFSDREVERLYVNEFGRITKRLYKASPWPAPDVISSLVQGDDIFLMLYRQIYYFHMFHVDMEITLVDRLDSFRTYIQLLDHILGFSVDHPDMRLPNAWLWNIVDEFITEFQSFHDFRGAVKSLRQSDVEILRDAEHAWAPTTVTRYLEELVRKGKNSPPKSMFKNLSQFATIALVRVNGLLCDYASSLELVAEIEFKENPCLEVAACNAALYYSMGLSYLMLRRYMDAAHTFRSFIKGADDVDESLASTTKWMTGLLALCIRLCPHLGRDETLVGYVKKEFSDDRNNCYILDSSDPNVVREAFSDIFKQCCLFVTCYTPNYDRSGSGDSNLEMSHLQLNVMLRELRQRAAAEEVSAHLRLCKSITVSRLMDFANNTGQGDRKVDEHTVATWLLNLKHKSRSLRWKNSGESEWQSSSLVDFYVANEVVHVVEQTTKTNYGDHFLKMSHKFDDLLRDLQRI